MKPYSNADNFIDLELTDEITKEQIVTSFRKDKRTHCLLLTLNHVYKEKQIVSPVCKGPKWNQTVKTLVKKLEQIGVSAPHIDLIEDVLNNNYEIVSLTKDGQEISLTMKMRIRNAPRKSRLENIQEMVTLPLHELIVFKDGQTAFLSLDENGQPKYETEIDRPGKILLQQIILILRIPYHIYLNRLTSLINTLKELEMKHSIRSI